MYPIMPCSSRSQDLVVENDLKNVACVVFYPTQQRENPSIYLIDLKREKLRGFAHLDSLELPLFMACVVHKSMLYMFGGDTGSMDRKVRLIGCREAYVLDLSHLASVASCGSDKKQIPVLKRIPAMKGGKSHGLAVVVDDKICVFDFILGHKPPDCSFEIFDPELGVWHTVPDPLVLKPGHFVDGYVVKDNKFFVSIRNNMGVYELNFCANAPPTWIHHSVFLGVEFLHVCARGLQVGSLLFGSSDRAYDLADERGVGHVLPIRQLGETADKNYEVCHQTRGTKFNLGNDEVCTIQPELLRKPSRVADSRHKSKRKWPTITTSARPLGPVVCTCSRKKKASYRLVVNLCSVDRTDEDVVSNVLRSFTVPMDYSDKRFEDGWISAASLLTF